MHNQLIRYTIDDDYDFTEFIEFYNENENVFPQNKKYIRDMEIPLEIYNDGQFKGRYRFDKNTVVDILVSLISIHNTTMRLTDFTTTENTGCFEILCYSIIPGAGKQLNVGKRSRLATLPYFFRCQDGLTHNQIDHILIDKRRHTSIVDIRTFRGADCNSDHYLVIGELRERLSVAKRVEQQVNITKFNILKLKDEEAKQNYQVEISNFATLESSDEVEKELDVNSVWENIRDSIKLQLSRA
ncbi:hypothetical protein ANN_13613 [Periplaneta americana]|uniref:Uncharacterized protein n=1 Tax=Periplaneta americana TaxID=6978 RepID=A0ABQ8TMH1_PERAM|nr:hypothetical protein ANN_13613 [Periplaneta americana]